MPSLKVTPLVADDGEEIDLSDSEFLEQWNLFAVSFYDAKLQKKYISTRVNTLNVTLASVMLFFCAPVWAIHCPRFWEGGPSQLPLNIFASVCFYFIYCLPLAIFLVLASKRELRGGFKDDGQMDDSGRSSTDSASRSSGSEGSRATKLRNRLTLAVERAMKATVPIGGALTCSSLMLARCIDNTPCTKDNLLFLNTWSCNPNVGTIPADTTFVCLIVPLFMHQMLKLEFRQTAVLWLICFGSVLISTIFLMDSNVSFWTTLCGASTLLLIVEGETFAASRYFTRLKEVMLVREVAESKQTTAVLRERQKIIRRVSHEMRSPLFVMTSALESIQELSLSGSKADPREALREIAELCAYCMRSREIAVESLDEVLLLDKVQSNNLTLNPEEVELAEYLAPLLTYFKSTVTRNKELKWALQDETAGSKVFVELDKRLFKQVLMNVIANAVKFSPVRGTITLRLLLVDGPAAGEEKSSSLVVELEDEGVGIAAEHISNMFNEGYQISPNKTQSGGGSGYGLYICKEIISRHAGALLWVESPGLGLGTKFIIKIPVRANHSIASSELKSSEKSVSISPFASVAAAAAAVSEVSPVPAPLEPSTAVAASVAPPMRNAYGSFIATLSFSPAILSGLCILVVDDSDMVRKMIRRMLENALERIELIEAVDGQDAVDKVKANHHIAGIIMDNMMPRLNGIEAINELKAMSFSGFIIGATGNTEHTDFHNAGVPIVLKKPFSRELLVSALCQSYVSRPTLAPATSPEGSSSSRPPAQIDIVVRNAEST